MKHILTIFLFFPFLTFAQDSCKLKKDIDSYTKLTKLSTGFIAFPTEKAQLAISIDANATEIDFFFWVREESKCFDDQSSIQINFEGDRLKSNFKNSGSMNCEGAFHLNFKNQATTPPNLRRLQEKAISTFKITGSNKSVTEVVLTPDQKVKLQRMINCIIIQSKALIK